VQSLQVELVHSRKNDMSDEEEEKGPGLGRFGLFAVRNDGGYQERCAEVAVG
jgi:hypothetical protein